MDYSFFANPPPRQFYTGVGVGIILSAILIVAFLRRSKRTKPTRSLTLVVLALISGPLLGAGICGLAILFGAFHPADRLYYLGPFMKVGAIAGVIGAILIGLLAKPDRLDSSSKSPDNDNG
ncbi:MAG: hypothetical protein K8R46_07120 [Pirellulales bacterium]|nr:hypothetical protein [Pirellulales bacterium]